MIFDFLVVLLTSAVAGIVAALPIAAAPDFSGVGQLASMVSAVNQVVPVVETGVAAGIYIGVLIAAAIFGGARQVWRFVPIIGGG